MTWFDMLVLIAATWAVLGVMRIVHSRLDRRWPVKQAEQLCRDASKDE